MEKPTITVDLSGEQGNIFTLMSEARAAILSDVRRLGFQTQKSREEQDRDKAHAEFVAEQMMREVMQTHTYQHELKCRGTRSCWEIFLLQTCFSIVYDRTLHLAFGKFVEGPELISNHSHGAVLKILI